MGVKIVDCKGVRQTELLTNTLACFVNEIIEPLVTRIDNLEKKLCVLEAKNDSDKGPDDAA